MDYTSITTKKRQLDVLQPLPPALLKNLADWFRVEITYTSNAIEGNTLTRQETAIILEQGLSVGAKPLKDVLETISHADAWDWIQGWVSRPTAELTEREILTMHEHILRPIDPDNAGRYRSIAVRIAGSRVILPNPLKVPDLMADFAVWLQGDHGFHPVEHAAMAHYTLVSIHPFVDGNGRTARLLMNLILMQHGYPPAMILKRERLAYLNSLETAQLGGSIEDYLKLMAHTVDRSLEIYLKAALQQDPPEQDKADAIGPLLRIGVLAKRSGESTATLRYWTKLGLLTVVEKTSSGYQRYALTMVERVKRIRELQQQRLTLAEIAAIVNREDEHP